jgi:hypothetical protein
MTHWQDVVYAFAAKPWHLIVLAAFGFVGFYFAGSRRDGSRP